MKIIFLTIAISAFGAQVCTEYQSGELCGELRNWGGYSTVEAPSFESHPEWGFGASGVSPETNIDSLCQAFGFESATRLFKKDLKYACSSIDPVSKKVVATPSYHDCAFPFGTRVLKRIRCI